MINNSTSISKPVQRDASAIHPALTASAQKEWHRNPLNLKGAGVSATKNTLVQKIRLVTDNTEHTEGKINEPNMVILTKYIRKFY